MANVKKLPEIFQPFYNEPESGGMFSTRLGKNRAYAQELTARSSEISETYLGALRSVKNGLPEDPNGSFAFSLIIKTGVAVIGAKGAEVFAEMLELPWVLDRVFEDPCAGFILLEGARLGGRVNILPIQEFCRQIRQRKDDTGRMTNLLSFAGRAMASCILNEPAGLYNCRQISASVETAASDLCGYVR